MKDTYSVSEWAIIRRNELVDIPKELPIHSDFLRTLTQEAFECAFREIGQMFWQIYSDMAETPENFGMPLYRTGEYDYFSKQAREARTAPWNLFYFLLCLFSCGEWKEKRLAADTEEIRRINRVKKTASLLKALEDYGFIFSGIKNYQLSSGSSLEVEYPDDPNVVEVLFLLAQKVKNTQMKDVKNDFSHMNMFANGFIGWNYKLLAEDINTCTLAQGCDYVGDKMHSEADRKVICMMDRLLTGMGYTMKKGDFNEGPSVRYYRGKSKVYAYALNSDRGNLCLELRIRNAENCLEYLGQCPDRIAEMFRHNDSGCRNRINGTCRSGVDYRFEGQEKWHCGCCGAPFRLHPRKEDIPHYIKLMELGNG